MRKINISYLFNNDKRKLYSFEDFLSKDPIKIFNNIFNIISGIIEDYIGDGTEERPKDKENIGYLHYDMSKMFIENQVDPFYCDRLFANKFVNKFKYIDDGSKQNKIYVFRGPPGSGKSTFLNCFVSKIEEYVNNNERMFETVWCLDDDLYPCPSHDNPIFLIPLERRKRIFRDILLNHPKLKERIFNDKRYEWLFKDRPCTFCSSMIQSLLDKGRQPLNHLFARQYKLDRRRGEGINIFNPNDELPKFKLLQNKKIQDRLDEYFKDQGSNISYDHSIYAKSNNGIYALMDLSENNKFRLSGLKGITSEGIHRVNNIEEQVKSIFLIVTNPEDEIPEEEDKALEDRKNVINMNYILVPQTQNMVFKKIYGDNIEKRFQPGIIDNFSRIIISSRLVNDRAYIKKWLNDNEYTNEILDLVKMEIYSGTLPEWIPHKHRKDFTKEVRKKIIKFADVEGVSGISNREAIELFSDFINYHQKDSLIDIKRLVNYCKEVNSKIYSNTTNSFIDAVEDLYKYTVLHQMKESMFPYNKTQIKNIILNYLYSLSYNIGETVNVPYTWEKIEITDKFYEEIEKIVDINKDTREKIYKRHLTEMMSYNNIEETPQYKKLYHYYIYNLKDSVLDKIIQNENFRKAIRDYGKNEFGSYDENIRKNVNSLIGNMCSNYGYIEQGAKEVCVYIIDNIDNIVI